MWQGSQPPTSHLVYLFLGQPPTSQFLPHHINWCDTLRVNLIDNQNSGQISGFHSTGNYCSHPGRSEGWQTLSPDQCWPWKRAGIIHPALPQDVRLNITSRLLSCVLSSSHALLTRRRCYFQVPRQSFILKSVIFRTFWTAEVSQAVDNLSTTINTYK